MHKHPFFDLLIHDDAELMVFLAEEIQSRHMMHEWPLSYVEKIITESGREMVYKVQGPPTVEAEFYQQVKAGWLLEARILENNVRQTTLLLPFLRAPRVADLSLTWLEVGRLSRQVGEELAQYEGIAPIFLKIGNQAQWLQVVAEVLEDIHQLLHSRRFVHFPGGCLQDLEGWAQSARVLRCVGGKAGLVHGDLTAENIFMVPGGYKVIDWQRPVWGAPAIDQVALLESLGYNPLAAVPKEVVGLGWFVRMHWFVQCALRWFPAGIQVYDHRAGDLAEAICRLNGS